MPQCLHPQRRKKKTVCAAIAFDWAAFCGMTGLIGIEDNVHMDPAFSFAAPGELRGSRNHWKFSTLLFRTASP
jgi:hypothetical protein